MKRTRAGEDDGQAVNSTHGAMSAVSRDRVFSLGIFCLFVLMC